MDVLNKNIKLKLNNQDKILFIKQISNDTQFLAKLNVMDYSLLLGINIYLIKVLKIIFQI
jgi:hypothetical protein